MWKKHYPVEGRITQHISPMEQNIVTPLLKDMHHKIFHKLTKFLIEAGPGLGFGCGVYWYCESKHEEIAFHHRS